MMLPMASISCRHICLVDLDEFVDLVLPILRHVVCSVQSTRAVLCAKILACYVL